VTDAVAPPPPSDAKPLIVQRDRTVLLDLHAPGADLVRRRLARFAELVKSPDHLHTYRLTPLSLWNAAGSGLGAEEMLEFLDRHSLVKTPKEVRAFVVDLLSRSGRVRLVRADGALVLDVDAEIRDQVLAAPKLLEHAALAHGRIVVDPAKRGEIKKALVKAGWPVDDLAGFVSGGALAFRMREVSRGGEAFAVRDYQDGAARAVYADGGARGGAGVVVLPCGAGKTVVGIRLMELYQTQTLVLTTNRSAVDQWIRELLERTTLTEDEVGEYTGAVKEIKPVTVSTYQILTHRRSATEGFTHFDLFSRNDWGLVVYDEVHLLPAPVFRVTAELQARRRLGLTATLVREDGLEDEVFSLIGPCRYDLPWRELERKGHIAEARCIEIRVALPDSLEERYALADKKERFRMSSENEKKFTVVRELCRKHAKDRVLVIGQFLRQLHRLQKILGAPLITSKTPHAERERLYASFRSGETPVLIVSKVANFAIDLPDANVAIEISGQFGSRQEEAQRLGRVLRKKKDGGGALFYAVVTADTRDQEFAAKRQLFLAEQGYPYRIMTLEEALSDVPRTECAVT
jgi:DNA excision repair protein ERCC-3